ncbi:MAG: hypothetical protein MI742_15240 [Desulfobacterales bacterium]|nr:hypothetical protein [Desulfobacterales bacterium]
MTYARTADELDALVEANPDRFATEFIEEDSFVEHLLKNHTMTELNTMAQMPANPVDMERWGLTEDQWQDQVTMAWLVFRYEHNF